MPAPLTPASVSAVRTSSTVADWLRLAWIRAPDSKSMPRLSCLVASDSAPMMRMQPEKVKNHLLAPLKSKFQRT